MLALCCWLSVFPCSHGFLEPLSGFFCHWLFVVDFPFSPGFLDRPARGDRLFVADFLFPSRVLDPPPGFQEVTDSFCWLMLTLCFSIMVSLPPLLWCRWLTLSHGVLDSDIWGDWLEWLSLTSPLFELRLLLRYPLSNEVYFSLAISSLELHSFTWKSSSFHLPPVFSYLFSWATCPNFSWLSYLSQLLLSVFFSWATPSLGLLPLWNDLFPTYRRSTSSRQASLRLLINILSWLYTLSSLGQRSNPTCDSERLFSFASQRTGSKVSALQNMFSSEAAYIVRAILQIRSAASACPEPKPLGLKTSRRAVMALDE